ncbi:MAG: septum formation initiator family protein [Prevotellaceae bacterium]|jgi:cell division protein FtsB|nr:septum formation initiator family protein [Prevotellaceae bacterium]
MKQLNYQSLKNKYVITIAIFIVWILFFDKTNVKNWVGEYIKNNRIERDKAHYEQEIMRVDNQLNLLRSNNDSLEKYAREKFYMRRDNEEIFIIED